MALQSSPGAVGTCAWGASQFCEQETELKLEPEAGLHPVAHNLPAGDQDKQEPVGDIPDSNSKKEHLTLALSQPQQVLTDPT